MISIASTELVAGVSGETEERIREVFEQASCLAPCVLFFDEVDVISSNRVNAQKDMDRRIVSQLISSIDGLDNKEGVNQVNNIQMLQYKTTMCCILMRKIV